MKKVVLSYILSLVFILLVATASAAQYKSDMLGNSLTDSVLVRYLPIGEDENGVGFKKGDAFNEGPESFAVLNDGVYVLDSVKNRIVFCNEHGKSYIDLSCCSYPTHMCVSDELIYVIDYNVDGIFVFNKLGIIHNHISLPEKVEHDSIKRITFSNGSLRLSTIDNDIYVFDGTWSLETSAILSGDFEETKLLTFKNRKIAFNTGKNTSAELLSINDNFIIVGVYEFVPYIPVIESEYTIRKYSLDGELIGSTVIETIPAISFPCDRVFVDDSNEVFVMQCRSNGVYITKPCFRSDYFSHMSELKKRGEDIWMAANKSITRSSSSITTKTRSEVLSRSNSAKNLQWTIKQADNNPPTGATKPHFINSNTVGTSVTGIPYCWGRYLSEAVNFSTQHNGNYTAGNINSSNHYVSYTTGLDCSGFVSYAYLLGSHNDTGELFAEGKFVNGSTSNSLYSCSLSNMKDMDFMLRYNQSDPNHVVLFHNYSSGSFTIYDSTTAGNRDKVSKRSTSASNMNDYYLKTPYGCGGTASCSYGSYQYDTLHHWRECTFNCGNTSAYNTHTWVNAPGGGYNCNVCGCHVSVLPYGADPVMDK